MKYELCSKGLDNSFHGLTRQGGAIFSTFRASIDQWHSAPEIEDVQTARHLSNNSAPPDNEVVTV